MLYDDPTTRRPTVIAIPCTYYRIKIDAIGGNFTGCRGRILSIARGGSPVFSGEIATLPFAQAENPDAISKTIQPGAPEYLDLLAITNENKVTLALHKFTGSNSIDWNSMFAYAGDYIFEIVVLSTDPAPLPIKLLFRWTLN